MDERKLRLMIIGREMNAGRMTVQEGLRACANLDEKESLAQRMETLARRREKDRERRARKKQETLQQKSLPEKKVKTRR
jgi:hypothetical protein